MSKSLNIAISEQKLAELILAGHLCAADVQCLDRDSKQALWQLCLWCCSKRTQCQHCRHPCALTAPKAPLKAT
ncbi:hypothetical protein [Shewanella sp. YIC-542]|uniref:hypothetical protein n=1 Tax=Shewanella mytili TaxID=3377111 RepID=UPI00398F0021